MRHQDRDTHKDRTTGAAYVSSVLSLNNKFFAKRKKHIKLFALAVFVIVGSTIMALLGLENISNLQVNSETTGAGEWFEEVRVSAIPGERPNSLLVVETIELITDNKSIKKGFYRTYNESFQVDDNFFQYSFVVHSAKRYDRGCRDVDFSNALPNESYPMKAPYVTSKKGTTIVKLGNDSESSIMAPGRYCYQLEYEIDNAFQGQGENQAFVWQVNGETPLGARNVLFALTLPTDLNKATRTLKGESVLSQMITDGTQSAFKRENGPRAKWFSSLSPLGSFMGMK